MICSECLEKCMIEKVKCTFCQEDIQSFQMLSDFQIKQILQPLEHS
jgi:hypothetical protein